MRDIMNETEPSQESKKYIHNCTKCGKCCEKWQEIPISIEDLQRWLNDGSINHILPFLQLQETPPAYVRLILKKYSMEGKDENPSGCPMYDYKNKICNIYFSMPIHCQAYPLAFNGEKFYLVDRDSPGLGNGVMTSESLNIARTRAKDHFNALNSSSTILPILYTIIIANIARKSQEAISSLSEEDQKKLEALLSKSKEEEEEIKGEEEIKEEKPKSVSKTKKKKSVDDKK